MLSALTGRSGTACGNPALRRIPSARTKELAIPQVRFLSHVQPGLKDGSYSLAASQRISSTSGSIAATEYPFENFFSVSGPRFSLNPSDVISMFPPPFSLGEYSSVLPHVVLSRPSLPWERSIDVSITDNDPPWLGVVLFNEEDPPPKIMEGRLLDLLPIGKTTADGRAGQLPAETYFPAFPLLPDKSAPKLDYGESWDDKCWYVDIPAEQFNRIMPSADDLGWLAHVREIDLSKKSETYVRKLCQTASDPDPLGKVAEVIGNRFALPGMNSSAHLVCLAGFGPVLPNSSGQSNLPTGTAKVRLVSLKNWTYSSVSLDYTFEGLLLNVNKPRSGDTLSTLQVPFQSTGRAGDVMVANAFKMGLTALDHKTRLGDRTVSWFHGPFVPFDLKTTVPFPGDVADQFTRYNPDSGMFDVSYSAAWQLGRLLGLQSSGYSSALYNWKRDTTQTAIRRIEETFLELPYAEMVDLLKRSLDGYSSSTSGIAPIAAQEGEDGAKSEALTTPAPTRKSRIQARSERVAAIRRTLTNPDLVSSLLGEQALSDLPELPAAVKNFLAQLRLLYGVPFNYLVPDERMLPPESLRFFYLDNAWIDSMLEGALSLGNSTSSDSAMCQNLSSSLKATSHVDARLVRPSLLNMSVSAMHSQAISGNMLAPAGNSTGFLLRSQVVTGWSGMEAHGYDSAGVGLRFLRLEQVGPGVLLGIFDGVVNKLVLNEHPEALHFGVDEDILHPDPKYFTKSLRYVAQVGLNEPGSPVPAATAAPLAIPNFVRSTDASVLRIADLATAQKSELNGSKVYDGIFTSAEFALEMIEGMGRVTFTFDDKRA